MLPKIEMGFFNVQFTARKRDIINDLNTRSSRQQLSSLVVAQHVKIPKGTDTIPFQCSNSRRFHYQLLKIFYAKCHSGKVLKLVKVP